ncbi:MAG: helix-turn-helix domain-containing protein [Fimbriimonadales bacterium]|nr:helix-turn-helix domain-containing protein [Fimbriimonadales bacterium]
MRNALREARKRTGMPMEVVARKAGVSLRCVWLWETWNLPPKRREVAQKIADTLGVSLEELGYDDSERPATSEPEQQPDETELEWVRRRMRELGIQRRVIVSSVDDAPEARQQAIIDAFKAGERPFIVIMRGVPKEVETPFALDDELDAPHKEVM